MCKLCYAKFQFNLSFNEFYNCYISEIYKAPITLELIEPNIKLLFASLYNT